MKKLLSNLLIVVAVLAAFSISAAAQKQVRVKFEKGRYGTNYKGKTEVIYVLNIRKGQLIDASVVALNKKDVNLTVTEPGWEEENYQRKYYGRADKTGDFKFHVQVQKGGEYIFNITVK